MNIHGHKQHAKLAAEREKHWASQEKEWGLQARRKRRLFERIKKWHHKRVIELKAHGTVIRKKPGGATNESKQSGQGNR